MFFGGLIALSIVAEGDWHWSTIFLVMAVLSLFAAVIGEWHEAVDDKRAEREKQRNR